ncbi:glycosyltransferase [bacterium]|nr:glycosyltransferase [bacterium]
MKHRLWIISELYYPETTSTGHILTKIAEGLTESFDVRVICGQPGYSARGTQAPAQEIHNEVNIQRCWGATLDKDILPLRLINLVTITISFWVSALRCIKRDDLVLVVTNPPTLPFAIALACQIKGAKCSLIVHDIYPDLAVAAGKLASGSALVKWLNLMNIWLYRSMERIFVLGRDMQVKIAEKLDKRKERVVVATNWADLDTIVPATRNANSLLQELNLIDKFVVQYAGNMGYPNDIETIIEAASILKEQGEFHFLFLGSGAKKRLIECAVEDLNLANVTTLGHRPRSDQSIFLNACDVALIALVVGMKGISVPSRTYNTLAAGKPIIAIVEDDSELAIIIEEESVGWVVPPKNPEKLVSVIVEAKKHPYICTEMAIRARKTVESKYTLEQVLSVFKTTLLSIT